MNDKANSLTWMQMHARLLFPPDESGGIRNRPHMPRFYLGSSSNGNFCRTRNDLPASIRARLTKIASDEPLLSVPDGIPIHAKEYASILAESKPIEGRWVGPAYRFPKQLHDDGHDIAIIDQTNIALLQRHHSNWIPAVGRGDPVCVLLIEGNVASICFSARVNTQACEAGVDTLEEARGNGYAASVVAYWASAVRLRGLEPLYSTSSENRASQAVARKLDLQAIGMDFHLT